MESAKPTTNTEALNEVKGGNESSSYLVQLLSSFKVTRLTELEVFLFDVNGQLIVIVMFGFCLVVNLIGGRPVFALSSFMGFCIATMLLIYLFGTLSALGTADVSYSHFSPLPVEFTWFNVMSGRPSVGGQFNCLQYFSLVGDLLEKPKEQLPRVWVVSMFIFVVMTVFVILASVSQTPSAKSLQKATFPMQGGYARKQLLALSQSGLFPSIFKKLVPGSDAPSSSEVL
eukprot:gene7222-biopygen1318